MAVVVAAAVAAAVVGVAVVADDDDAVAVAAAALAAVSVFRDAPQRLMLEVAALGVAAPEAAELEVE